MAWLTARRDGFDEAVLCNQSSALCEASRANLFWSQGGALFTPALDSGCLPGIAREIVIEMAAQHGLPTREGLFSLPELSSAHEVFLTSATTGPRSLAQFYDGSFINEYPSPGPVTTQLQALWREFVLA